jgi:hypothetical protein
MLLMPKHMIRPGLIALLLLAAVSSTSDEQTVDSTPASERPHALIEQGAAPAASPLPDGRDTQQQLPRCWSRVQTFIRREMGTDCNSYAAEISGYAQKCVEQCDPVARYREAVAAAEQRCAEFCRAKNCPGPRYQPPANCEATDCFTGAPECTLNECPLFDACYLMQSEHAWNCICVES